MVAHLARRLAGRASADAWLEFLLPQRCVACGRFGAALHEVCASELPRAAGSRCRVCWAPSRTHVCERCAADEAPGGFTELRAPFRFAGAARRALLEAKFRGVTALLPSLGREAAGVAERSWRVDVVVPIPLAPRREAKRGFNQAALLADEIAAVLGVPVEAGRLVRTREGVAQASLGAEERATNLVGAFAAEGFEGRRVLLVDDVTTTGSTLDEAARAVRAAGAAAVFAVAVARED
jgi:ComF family protein